MSLNKEQEELMEKYLMGTLTEIEQKSVNDLLDSSPDFTAELSFRRKALAHLDAVTKTEMKAEMLANYRSIKSVNTSKNSFSRVSWVAAASITIIITVTLIYYFYTPDNKSEILGRYYIAYNGVSISRGENSSFAQALSAYYQGDYDQALDAFKNNTDTRVSDGQLYLLIASCYMGLDQPENSIIWLKKIPDNETQLVQDNKQWYLALAYLSNGKSDISKDYLKAIIDSKSSFASYAKRLLEEDIYH